jgi:hypothetical protein
MQRGYIKLVIRDKGKVIHFLIEKPEAIRIGMQFYKNRKKVKITQNALWLLLTAPEPTKIAKQILKDYKGKVVSLKVVKSYLK